MQNIFYGMLLSFLNFDLNIGDCKIGLIPDCLGYILMIKGINELMIEGSHFKKIKPYIELMVVYTSFLYIADLLNIRNQINEILTITVGIIFTIISLYIVYSIIKGITDIEHKYKCNLKSGILYSLWKARVVFVILGYVATLTSVGVVIIIIIGFIINIYFLVEFNHSKNLYYRSKINN